MIAFINTLSDTQFNDRLDINTGTIGAHVRHIVEHYQSLMSSNSTVDNHVIDYDKRERNISIETSRVTASSTLNTLVAELSEIKSDFTTKVLCSTNTDDQTIPTDSTLRRELVFLHSHTTHHMAIIRMIALLMKISVSNDFGKAASTQKFERNVQS